jgi:hypothetical protein
LSVNNDQEAKMATKTAKAKNPTKAKRPAKEPAAKKAGGSQARVEETTELSERVLEEVETGQQSAIEAVRQFMESVDKALPPHGENASRRQEVIDSALEMSERLVRTQYDFLRSVVHSAGETLGALSKKE